MSLPDAQEINAGLSLCTSKELIDYFIQRLVRILESARLLNDSEKLMGKVYQIHDQRQREEHNSADIWQGYPPKTAAEYYQDSYATEAADFLYKDEQDAVYDFFFAINEENATLLRAYLNNAQMIDPASPNGAQKLAALDKLFNSWLAKNGYLTKDGTIYLMKPNGDIDKDLAGNPIKANANDIKKLLGTNDYQKYLLSKDIKLNAVHEQAFPETKKAAPVTERHVVAEAASKTVAPEAAPVINQGV